MSEDVVIRDSNGTVLEIGMRVGCRDKGEPRGLSRRGLTLTGYEPATAEPYITNGGRFAIATKDHQSDMDEWIKQHVRPEHLVCGQEGYGQ